MKKTLISLLLVVVLALALTVPAMAANSGAAVTVDDYVSGSYISASQYVLLEDNYTDTLEVTSDLYLDLNGKTVNKITVTGGTLYLFDSTTDDYVVENDSYGKVTQIEVTGGKVAREFVLPAALGTQYRYITLKDANGSYSAHRFWLGVYSSLLYPRTGSLYYRVAFLGDSVVSGYVGEYGGHISLGTAKGVMGDNFVPRSIKTVNAYDEDAAEATNRNYYTITIDSVLNPAYAANWVEGTMDYYVNGRAFINLTDSFGEQTVFSSVVGKSFQEAVLEAQAQIDGMTTAQVTTNRALSNALTGMYKGVIATEAAMENKVDLLTKWSDGYNHADGTGIRIPYYCECGAVGTTHKNGCSEDKHLWVPYGTDISNLQNTSSTEDASEYNCYLTGDTAVKMQLNWSNSDYEPVTVRMNLNGHNIDNNNNNRVFAIMKAGHIVISNTRPGENGNVIQAKGPSDTTAANNFGAIIAMLNNTAESQSAKMLEGVTLKLREDHNSMYRGAIVQINGGSFDMYGGRIEGVEVSNRAGAVDVNKNATFTMHDGDIVGGSSTVASGVAGGGVVFVAAGSSFNMKDGTISGGSAWMGGNVFLDSTAQMTMEGGLIENGGADASGGNVLINDNATLSMSGEAIISGGYKKADGADKVGGNIRIMNQTAVRTVPNLTMSGDAEISGGNTYYVDGNSRGAGGNIWMGTNAYIKLIDTAHITNGVSSNNGGNVHCNGVGAIVEMRDDSYITGGVAGKTTSTANNTTHDSADIWMQGGAILRAYGGTAGRVDLYTANCSVMVSGDPIIKSLKLATNLNAAVDGVVTGGRIYLKNRTSGTVATISATMTDQQKEKAATCFYSMDESKFGWANGTNTITLGDIVHCVCGAAKTADQADTFDHTNGCDEIVETWQPYEGVVSTTGNFYLTAANETSNYGQRTVGANQTVKIDLNGYNLNASQRAFALNAAGSTLWLCNTAPAVEGTGIVQGNGPADNSHSGVVMLVNGTKFNMIGNVTLKLAEEQNTFPKGGVVTVDSGIEFNMYGGTIIGGNVTNAGGAVWLNNGTFNMHAGKIIGGNAPHGGAVYVQKNTGIFNLRGGEIIGGTATDCGGAIRVDAGELNMYGGKITGGTATNSGGAIFVSTGKMDMHGGEIIGGTAGKTGGAIYLNIGNLNLYAGKISGGQVNTAAHTTGGGNIWAVGGKLLIDEIYKSEGKTVTIENGKVTANGNYEVFGGNVGLYGGSHEMKGGTITGGSIISQSYSAGGGNVYIRAGITFTMSGGSVTNGVAGHFVNANGATIRRSQGGNFFVLGVLDISGDATVSGGVTQDGKHSKDVFCQNGKVFINGGHIGEVAAHNNKTGTVDVAMISLQGDAKIDKVTFTAIANGSMPVITIGENKLGNDASIGINGEIGTCLIPQNVTAISNWLDVVGNVNALRSLTANSIIKCELDGIYVRSNTDNGETVIGPCGNVGCTTETHDSATCPLWGAGAGLVWEPLTTHSITRSGNYYLTDNIAPSGVIRIGASGNTDKIEVRLNLNGYNIDSDWRSLQVWNNSELSIYNNSTHQTGNARPAIGGVITSKANKENTTDDAWALVQMVSNTEYAPVVNMYDGVTLQNTGVSYDGAGVGVNSGTFNMYGGTVKGGKIEKSDVTKAYNGNGGAFHISEGAELNVYGGEIFGNQVEKFGGAIYNLGTANLNNVTISNGTADQGGAIYNTGTLTLNNVTLKNNTATTGDNIYTANDITIDGNIALGGEVFMTAGKHLVIGENLNLMDASLNIDYDINLCEGRVTDGASAVSYMNKIKAEGKALVNHSDGYLYLQPKAANDQIMVGYGEASLNPTDEQVNYSKNGYTDEKGYYPVSLIGYGTNPAGKIVHTDSLELKATAVAYSDYDGDVIVMIGVDACTVKESASVIRAVAEAVGVPVDNIMISAAHQHSTPDIRKDYRTFTKGSDTVTLTENYYDTFVKGVVAAAKAAVDSRAEVTGVSTAYIQNVNDLGKASYNKIFTEVRNYEAYDASGNKLGMWTPNHQDYKGTASSYKPEEYVDDDVQLVKYTFASGKPLVLANFQTHPLLWDSSSTGDVHADVVGVFRYELAQDLGANVAYFSGASGDIHPRVDVGDKSKNYASTKSGCYSWGENLATVVSNNIGTLESRTIGTDVAIAKRTVTEPVRAVGASRTGISALERYELATKIKATGIVGELNDKWLGVIDKGYITLNDGTKVYTDDLNTKYDIFSSYHINRMLVQYVDSNQRVIDGKEPTNITMDLFAYQAGNISFACAPYEMFGVNGMQVKYNDKGHDITIVATKINNATYYIPSQKGYDNGGYSTDITPFEPGTGEAMRDEFLAMLNGFNK